MALRMRYVQIAAVGLWCLPVLAHADEPPIETPVAAPAGHWYDQITVNGFASASYTGNFNDPGPYAAAGGTPATREVANGLRVFDYLPNSFSIDVAELVVQLPAAAPGDVGARIDFAAGMTIPWKTAAAGLSAGSFDLQQAFASYIAPIGRGLRIDFGKFVTPAGAEVIEGYDGYNDNYSRSILFGYAIPFTHVGLRISYPIADMLTATAFVVNGWDVAVDNNDGKTFGLQLALTPTPKLTATLLYLGGPEGPEGDDTWRHLVDAVVIFKPLDALAVTANFDFGKNGDPKWYGVAGTIRYDLSEAYSLAVRGEFFDDPDGVRTGTVQSLIEATATLTRRIGSHFAARAEFRWDHSDKDTFLKSGGEATANQLTLAVNYIAMF